MTTASIGKANISVSSMTANSKVYDGTTVATSTGGNLTGVISGDTVTLVPGAGSFDSKHAGGGKTVTFNNLTLSGADAGNYALASQIGTASADITRLGVTVSSIAAKNKVYDGTASASISGEVNGVLTGDTVNLATGTAGFADKNVGTAKTVSYSGLTLSGADANNYDLITTAGTATADITRAMLAPSASASNKTYDGTTSVSISGSLSGAIAGDSVALSIGSASFNDKNAGMNKPVSYGGLSLAGADAGNYTLSATDGSTTANIAKATLTPNVSAESRAYNGKTTATLKYGPLSVFGSDVVTLAGGTGTFNNKNAGTGKTVSYSGLSLSGADAGNYQLASASGTTTADIAKATLSVGSVAANNRTYDGTTAASLNFGAPVGVVSGDSVAISGTGSFSDKNAGTGKTATYSNLTLTGAGAVNYQLASTTGTTTGDIGKRNVTPRFSATARTYDGTTNVTFTRLLSNLVTGDSVTLNVGSASFSDKAAGTGKPVTYSGLTLTGTDANNYALSQTTVTGTGTVNKANLTPVVTASDKVYDGGISAVVSGTLGGVISGDAVDLTTGIASFDSSAVGANKTVTYSGLSLTGLDANNYALTKTSGTAQASILPLPASSSPLPNASSTTLPLDGGKLQTISVTDQTVTTNTAGTVPGSSGPFGITLPEEESSAVDIQNGEPAS
jgi:hypothetical protein